MSNQKVEYTHYENVDTCPYYGVDHEGAEDSEKIICKKCKRTFTAIHLNCSLEPITAEQIEGLRRLQNTICNQPEINCRCVNRIDIYKIGRSE